jgi:hypothetical protein
MTPATVPAPRLGASVLTIRATLTGQKIVTLGEFFGLLIIS